MLSSESRGLAGLVPSKMSMSDEGPPVLKTRSPNVVFGRSASIEVSAVAREQLQ